MTDQGAAPAPQAPVQPGPEKTGSRSKFAIWTQIVVAVVLVVVFVFILIAKFITRNDLPGCDSTQAKDTLSSIFKQRNVDASRYDEIKTVTTDPDDITCNATLTLRDNSKLAIEYKIYRQPEGGTKLLITRSNP